MYRHAEQEEIIEPIPAAEVEIIEPIPAVEEEIIEPIPDVVVDGNPAVPLHSVEAAKKDIATPVPVVSSQNSSNNPAGVQHNYRRSRRIQLLQSKKSCGKLR